MNESNVEIIKQKKNLRKAVKEKLKLFFTTEGVKNAEAKANEKVILQSDFNEAEIVLAFLHAGEEISCDTIIQTALSMNKKVALPRVIPGTSEMNFFFIKSGIDLESQVETGSFNIREPLETLEKMNPALLTQKKVFAVIPGLAFTKNGKRLGKGKGFYDRYIPKIKAEKLTLCGLCFDFQLVQNIPSDSHDIKVDFVATENAL